MSIQVDTILPFPGYREAVPGYGFGRNRPVLHPSLEHFYQSERFRGTDEELRAAIIAAPTPKEARKLALRHAEQSRPDWAQCHQRIMNAGLWMQLREHPRLGFALRQLGEEAAIDYPYRDPFWAAPSGEKAGGGFARLVHAARRKLNGQTVRVAVTGGRGYRNEFLLKTKLEGFFTNLTPDVMLVGGGKGAEEMVERWAIERCLPVRHFFMRGRGSRTEQDRHYQGLLRAATHVVVFSQGEASIDRLVELAKQFGRPTRIVLTDPSGATLRSQGAGQGRPERGATVHSLQPRGAVRR